MTKREFLDKVFALAPNEANAIMDAFDEYVDSNEPHWIPVTEEPMNDLISRQQAIEAVQNRHMMLNKEKVLLINDLEKLPSAQPEIVRCKDCIYYDPPHVENNGVRYEYDEMPADAFDALGTGLVNAEYGINIGGRCCVDYYCKNYSDDKRVFVREDNYCGRAERRTDEQTKD